MISIFQFMALYEGCYYKCHCFYIFTIYFLFSSTQSYSLFFLLFINYYYFSSMHLSIITVSAFVFVYGRCSCLCACLRSELVFLSLCFVVIVGTFMLICWCIYLILGYSWCRVIVVWQLSLICLPVGDCC